MSVLELRRPDSAPPAGDPPCDHGEPPSKYQLIFHPGIRGTCAGSFCILRDVFRMKADDALMTLIDSTLSEKEVVYTGWYDAVTTKFAEAEAARQQSAERFPRLARVTFTFEAV